MYVEMAAMRKVVAGTCICKEEVAVTGRHMEVAVGTYKYKEGR